MKHDATKEVFKRTLHTKLSIDAFKKFLSYFCLASYYDEKFEFTEEEVLEYLKKALRIEPADVDPEQFLSDLTESVCTLQRDGLQFVFTHRSFQEFFAAYCLSRVASKHVAEILPHMSRRPTDAVIGMLYEMNPDLVESDYVIPRLTDLLQQMSKIREDHFLAD